jgi:hypothetical protein
VFGLGCDVKNAFECLALVRSLILIVLLCVPRLIFPSAPWKCKNLYQTAAAGQPHRFPAKFQDLTRASSSLLLSSETPEPSQGASSGGGEVAGAEKAKKKKHRDSISVHRHREEKLLLQQQQPGQQQPGQAVAEVEAADAGPDV